MTNFHNNRATAPNATGISLQHLVHRLVDHSQRHNAGNSNSVANKVPAGFMIMVDESKLSPLIYDILASVLMNARNGDIHITAEKYNDTATLSIEDRNSYNGYAVACRLNCIEADARKMGASIDHKGKSQLVSTTSFSFPTAH